MIATIIMLFFIAYTIKSSLYAWFMPIAITINIEVQSGINSIQSRNDGRYKPKGLYVSAFIKAV